MFMGKWQGAATVAKWREEVLADWEKRWQCLKKQSDYRYEAAPE